jgi:uncharacterized membrane protein YccC
MTETAIARKVRRVTRYRRQMVHASRMTAAGLAAYALVNVLGVSAGLYAMITAIIVTQSSLGGSLKMALEQAAGTLFGALYAPAVMLLVAPADHLTGALALAVALAPLSFLAAFSPGYRAAPVTGVIVLFAEAGLGFGPFELAAGRILEVTLGCGVGIVVSVLVIPAQASRSVVETTAEVAGLLGQQLRALAALTEARQGDLSSLAGRLRDTMIRLERLVEEAARERRALLTELPDVEPLLRTTRRLRHDVGMLRRAAREAGDGGFDEPFADAWRRAVEAGAAALERIERGLPGGKPVGDAKDMAEAVRTYRSSLDRMRKSGLTEDLSTAALSRLFGISFALDQFRRDLDDLIERCSEIAARMGARVGPLTRDGSA